MIPVSPFRIIAPLLGAFLPAVLGHGQVLQGTATEVERGRITLQTPAGVITLRDFRGVTVTVSMTGKESDLPEKVNGFLTGSFISSASPFQGGDSVTVTLALAGSGPDKDAQHVMTSEQNGRTTLQNVPGVLQKGNAGFTFTPKGSLEYLTHRKDGTVRTGPARKDITTGQELSLPLRLGIAYDFGDDLSLAGARPTVTVNGDPARPSRITIVRTEPLDPTLLGSLLRRIR